MRSKAPVWSPRSTYVLQHSTDAEDGGRQRTDAVIKLPKGRKLIIDSKNLMESYIALANAQDDGAAGAARRGPLQIAEKPHQGAFGQGVLEALRRPRLRHPLYPPRRHVPRRYSGRSRRHPGSREKRVFISNPMTLIPLLKAIRYVLDQERLNKSAEEISKVGTELYEEIARFANHMGTIGDRLKSTVKAYNDSIPGLDRFIVAKSRKLKQLGSAKGPEAELPDAVDLEPRPFASPELSPLNLPADERQRRRSS